MPKVGGKSFPYTAKGKAAAKAYSKKKKRKVSDQSSQSAKRAKRRGSKKAPGRPLTAAEERYFSGKRYA